MLVSACWYRPVGMGSDTNKDTNKTVGFKRTETVAQDRLRTHKR
jgi:hypothetical protein